MLSFQELKDKIKEVGVSEFAEQTQNAASQLPPYTCVHSEGGHEGQGESVERVFFFADEMGLGDGIYVAVDGYYSSYDGREWETEPYQVFAVPTTVTLYKTQEQIQKEFNTGKTV